MVAHKQLFGEAVTMALRYSAINYCSYVCCPGIDDEACARHSETFRYLTQPRSDWP